MKEKGKIEECLNKTLHHVQPHKIGMLCLDGAFGLEQVASYRFKLVTDNLTPVLQMIREIRVAAEKGDCNAVLEVLNREIEFGHDF